MLNICTLSDRQYMLQGLALHHSLKRQGLRINLYWLCLDDETFDALSAMNISDIYPVKLSLLEKKYPELLAVKNLPPRLYGDTYSQYCWTLTPVFICFLLSVMGNIDHVIYTDSDISFYHSPDMILDAMGEKSIGIHSHRGESKYDPVTNPVGQYNVGVVAVKNTDTGRRCMNWWKECMLNPHNRYSHIYGTCGDQKYLDLFIPLFGDVCVFDQVGCGYLAPWCCDNVMHTKYHLIKYKGKEEKVIFFHFSHFRYDINAHTWSDSHKGEWNPVRIPMVRRYYESYFADLTHLNSTLCSTSLETLK